MTIIKDKRTGFYKARVKTSHGTTKTISTKATTKPEARRVAKQSKIAEIEEAAKAGRLTAEAYTQILAGRRVTVEEAITAYGDWQKLAGRSPASIYNAQSVLMQFGEGISGSYDKVLTKPLGAITEKMVYDYLNSPNKRSLAWRNTQRSLIVQFFEFCQAKGWLLGNPGKLVRVRADLLSHKQKEPQRGRNPFTDGEVANLLKATELGSFWHSAIAIGRYTGLRLGDIAQLEWDVFSISGKITVWTDKRDRRISIDLAPELATVIAAIPPVNQRYVFPEEREIYRDVKRKANLSTYFRRVCDAAGVTGKTFHDLRSSYVADCVRKGIPMEHIAKDVGHVRTETTRGYLPRD